MDETTIKVLSDTPLRRPLTTDLSIVELMAENGIEAILWKGRSATPADVDVDGDIDLLVRSNDKHRAERVLQQQGFRFVANAKWRHQPCVYDWYGVGNTRLVHVQLYDQLILGSYASKQILVPNQESLFLTTATTTASAYASDTISAVLLVCRATLLSPYHPGKNAKQLIDEAKQLESSIESITETAAVLFDEQTAIKVASAYETGNVDDLKQALFQRFQAPEPSGGAGPKAHIVKYAANINRRTLGLPVLPRRSLNRPAPIIALIGSDGSGKSTAATVSAKRINSKIDTRFIYFGTGDGESSLLRLPLVLLKRFREKHKRRQSNSSGVQANAAGHDDVPGLAKAVWAISVALERRSKMMRAKKYAAAGIIVITDRYPQNEFAGIHDGPRLSTWVSEAFKKEHSLKYKLAKWEQQLYEQLSSNHPDLLVLLDVDLRTASVRRPDERTEDLERRIDVAKQLKYGNAKKVVIDAAEPLDVVHEKTIRAILETATHEV